MVKYGVPSIVLTGSYNKKVRDEILSNDILDYLVKGGHAGRVLEHISNILRRLRKNRDIKIMVVDDSSTPRRVIRKLLETHKYTVIEAENGLDALEKMEQHPDMKMVITDYHMPEMDGFDLVSRLRQNHSMDELAVIGLSSSTQRDLTTRFLKMGANDFLHKNFSHEEFHCRVRQNIELVERFLELRENSNRDYLTGLYNRRFFYQAATDVYEAMKRGGSPFAVAMIDIDYFKKINDTHGHAAGDDVLRVLADHFSKGSRKSDIVARMGGEEFCFFATNMNAKFAKIFFRKLCKSVAQISVPVGQGSIQFTISTGVVTQPGENLDDMIKRADEKLYQAKEQGRNRVIVDEV